MHMSPWATMSRAQSEYPLDGVSPSGKAGAFEASIRWFESSHPSMTLRESLAGLFESWRAGDALRSSAYFAPDAIYGEASRLPIVGRDEIVRHFTDFFRDGPRFAFDVDDTIVEGERAAVRYRFSTFDSAGRKRERAGFAFVRFANGTIVEWREYDG